MPRARFQRVQIQARSIQGWDNGSAINSSALSFSGPFTLQALSPASTEGTLNLELVLDPGPADLQGGLVTVNLAGTNACGALNLTYVDRIFFTISAPSSINFDPNYFGATLTNSAGTNFQPTNVGIIDKSSVTEELDAYTFVCDFTNKSPRSAFADITQIAIGFGIANYPEGATPSTDVNIPFYIWPMVLGQVNATAYDQGQNPVSLEVGYTYYSTVTGLESQISPTALITAAQIQGGLSETDPTTNTTYYEFARPKLFLTKDLSSGTWDNYRIYGRRSTDTDWFLIQDTGAQNRTGTGAPSSGLGNNDDTYQDESTGGDYYVKTNGAWVNEGLTEVEGLFPQGGTDPCGSNKTVSGITYDATFSIRETWEELSTSSVFALGASVFENLISAVAYKGWVVWGFSGGYANLQHSQIGNELVLYNNADLTQVNPSNTAAPANFTLADNGSDDPIAMFPVDQSLIILGSHGVYAQSGYSPTTMSPPYKLPTALGCCGQYACCLWHDDIGNPGVAFVSKNGEGIYMAQQDLYYLNETHYKIVELSLPIRGAIQSFLLGGGATLAGIRMGVDQARDALWIIAGNRAIVLRRPSMAASQPGEPPQRHFEFYEYTFSDSGTVAFIAFDTLNRERWIRTTGCVDENEWDSSLEGYITGTDSDAGNPLSPLYYTTKKVTFPQVQRVMFVEVDRENLADQPTLTIASTRETTAKTCSDGLYFLRYGLYQQGREHQLTIGLIDGQSPIKRVLMELRGPQGDRYRS